MANSLGSWDDIVGTPKQLQNLRARNERDSKKLDLRSKNQKEDKDAWEVKMPKDVENVGVEMQTAPTINPKRPRALSIGYNPNTQTLIVIFRDNTWWQYNNVFPEMWEGLKNTGSTGKFLKEEGLDNWPSMGPADQSALTDSVAAQFSSVANSASRLQADEPEITSDEFRSMSAKEFFKDQL